MFVALLLTGCQRTVEKTAPSTSEGMRIQSISSALERRSQEEVYTYTVILANGTEREITVNSIVPVVAAALVKRVDARELPVTVGQRLAPGGTIEISGKVLFQASDLSKRQLSDLMPLITEFRIISEQSLPILVSHNQKSRP